MARRYRQDTFATSIHAANEALQAKADITVGKELDRQAATNNVASADADLEDAIRTLFNSSEIHERENPDSVVISTLFPTGGFTSISKLNVSREPAEADALAVRLDGLGATHPLAPHSAK